MNTTATAPAAPILVLSGKGTKVHSGYLSSLSGRYGVDCGQTPSARTYVRPAPAGAEITCTRCLARAAR